MTYSGILFLTFGMIIAIYVWHRRLFDPPVLSFFLFFYHLGFSLFCWNNSLNRPSDSNYYYLMARNHTSQFGMGGNFIIWVVRQVIGISYPSYLDMFLLFQMAGFLGFCILYKTILENLSGYLISRRVKLVMYIILFLPNLHYWTASMGKDSLIFLGITTFLWSLMKPKRRCWTLFPALLLIALIRPHIAVLLLAAIGITLLWSRTIPLQWRTFIAIVLFSGLIVMLPLLFDYAHIKSIDVDSVDDFISSRETVNLVGGGAVDMRDYNHLTKFLTYLYRPLFFDAHDFLGLIVSFESLIWIMFSMVIFSKYFLQVIKEHPHQFFIRFNITYFVLAIIFLSSLCSNLGIAVRQKNMALPCLMILIVVTYTKKREKFMKASGGGLI